MISKRLKSEHVVDKTVWPSKMGFFVYIILIGNGSNILPQSMKTLHKLSSGYYPYNYLLRKKNWFGFRCILIVFDYNGLIICFSIDIHGIISGTIYKKN